MPQKGKHRPPHRQEKKQRTAPVAPAQTQQSPIQTPTPRVTPVKVGVRSGTPQSAAAFTQARFPFIGAELKLIGIIALALIIVLIVLAIVLPPLLP